MPQPMLPPCLSWSTFTSSTDAPSSCSPSWPSADVDPGTQERSSPPGEVSAAINSSLKARCRGSPAAEVPHVRIAWALSRDGGEEGGHPGGGRGSVPGWVDVRGKGAAGKLSPSGVPRHMGTGWQRWPRAIGGKSSAPLSHFRKGMRCTGRAHKICICCQQSSNSI